SQRRDYHVVPPPLVGRDAGGATGGSRRRCRGDVTNTRKITGPDSGKVGALGFRGVANLVGGRTVGGPAARPRGPAPGPDHGPTPSRGSPRPSRAPRGRRPRGARRGLPGGRR